MYQVRKSLVPSHRIPSRIRNFDTTIGQDALETGKKTGCIKVNATWDVCDGTWTVVFLQEDLLGSQGRVMRMSMPISIRNQADRRIRIRHHRWMGLLIS